MTPASAPAAAPATRRLGPRPAPYDHLSAAERYLHLTRDESLLAVLRRHGVLTLSGLRILELGCGEGALLRSLLYHGAEPSKIEGVDIDSGRARRARATDAHVGVADIAALPYRDAAFDLAFAFTVFSSVLDRAARLRATAEAMRVLRPGGLLVVYDFWINPLNSRVRPLRTRELRALFAPRAVELERVTLAPPIARALGGRPALCAAVERLPLLRSHLLAVVVKEG